MGIPQLMMSILSQPITNPWISLLALVVTFAGVGFFFWIMTAPGIHGGKALPPEEAQKIDEIASAASAQVESSRARTLELLAEKLPSTEAAALPELIRELETIAARSTPTPEADPIQPLVRDLVNDYQRQALNQSKVQFRMSVVAAGVGFLVIISLAVVPAVLNGANALDVALSSVPGVIIEAVAALFFTQAREIRQRATELYDRLRLDSQQSQAIGLANSIENEEVRSELKSQLALHFAGINVSRSPENTSEQRERRL